MKKIFIAVLCCTSVFLQAQNTKSTEVGFNISPLLTTFISIGDVSTASPPITFTWKRIRKNGRVLRIASGFDLRTESGFNVPTNNRFYFHLGFERRRDISEKWKYYWGGDVLFNLEDNLRERSLIANGVGLGPIVGLSYVFNDKISISTESSMYLLFGDETAFSFIPPTSLYFNMKFKKQKRKRRRDRIAEEFID